MTARNCALPKTVIKLEILFDKPALAPALYAVLIYSKKKPELLVFLNYISIGKINKLFILEGSDDLKRINLPSIQVRLKEHKKSLTKCSAMTARNCALPKTVIKSEILFDKPVLAPYMLF
jgi:hypothetical protein